MSFNKRPNFNNFGKRPNNCVNNLKRQQMYTREYTPYMIALFCLTLKHNIDLSNDDIEHLVDCFQEEAEKSVGMIATFKECEQECGLSLYAEPDKAKVSK